MTQQIATSSAEVNPSRTAARRNLARAIVRAPYEKLIKYGISSYRDITGLDTIGLPIWIANRPLALTISVTAGKNLDPLMAQAGSIIEAIEFWASENPSSAFVTKSHRQIAEGATSELLPLTDYPLAAENVLDDDTPLPWELVNKISRNLSQDFLAWMPSNMIWLKDRVVQQFLDVQQSSNGLAAGTTVEDAILQGLYELIERDGWTNNQFVRETLGIPPRKVPTVGLPEQTQHIIDVIKATGLFPFLYDCSSDLKIPVIGCALFGRDGVGLFGGYGCHFSPQIAAERALLEAVQSRLCYISGARDDLYRRDFILMKRSNSDRFVAALSKQEPVAPNWKTFLGLFPFSSEAQFNDVKDELISLLSLLETSGIDKVYYKLLASEEFNGEELKVIKVIAPQLEGAWCDNWKTTGRAPKHLEWETQSCLKE